MMVVAYVLDLAQSFVPCAFLPQRLRCHVMESEAISHLLPPTLVAGASGDADDTAWVAAPWLGTFSCGLTALVPLGI
jgi:hypothetical protein